MRRAARPGQGGLRETPTPTGDGDAQVQQRPQALAERVDAFDHDDAAGGHLDRLY